MKLPDDFLRAVCGGEIPNTEEVEAWYSAQDWETRTLCSAFGFWIETGSFWLSKRFFYAMRSELEAGAEKEDGYAFLTKYDP
jgi:hypothetical protein